jgi:Zn-finger nucleic acid-binding protein
MITFELEAVEIDHCTGCGGIWLDAGELEELFGDRQQAEEVINSFEPDETCAERPRKCPICSKKMQKIIAANTEPRLLLDRCRSGDGLWFDRGELRQIMAQADLDPDHKVQQLLSDMFGRPDNGRQ